MEMGIGAETATGAAGIGTVVEIGITAETGAAEVITGVEAAAGEAEVVVGTAVAETSSITTSTDLAGAVRITVTGTEAAPVSGADLARAC